MTSSHDPAHLIIVVFVSHVFDDVVSSVHRRLDFRVQLLGHAAVTLQLFH